MIQVSGLWTQEGCIYHFLLAGSEHVAITEPLLHIGSLSFISQWIPNQFTCVLNDELELFYSINGWGIDYFYFVNRPYLWILEGATYRCTLFFLLESMSWYSNFRLRSIPLYLSISFRLFGLLLLWTSRSASRNISFGVRPPCKVNLSRLIFSFKGLTWGLRTSFKGLSMLLNKALSCLVMAVRSIKEGCFFYTTSVSKLVWVTIAYKYANLVCYYKSS